METVRRQEQWPTEIRHARALTLGLDPKAFSQESDAFSFFSRLEDAIMTGPTNNNLRDLRIFLAEP